jgi:hypothetical protein
VEAMIALSSFGEEMMPKDFEGNHFGTVGRNNKLGWSGGNQ